MVRCYAAGMKRPVSLTIAVVLQWISAIAGIIAGIALALSGLAALAPEARRAFESALAQEGVTGINGADIGIALFVLGLLTLAISVVRVIVAVSLGRGRNWARILISVFAVLNLIVSIAMLFTGDIIGGIIAIVIELVILWLMWNPSSSAYVRARSAERAVSGS